MFTILTEVVTEISKHKHKFGEFNQTKNAYEGFEIIEGLYSEAEEFINKNYELAFNTLSLNDGSDNGNKLLTLLEKYLGQSKV